MSYELSRFDAWISQGGPSALVLKEYLQPAAGQGAVIFPPTFAPPEEERRRPSGYIIDRDGDWSTCLLDSAGSQANRLEPLFMDRYADLVPQITVNVDGRSINLLTLGHRAADAVIRSTALAPELDQAFRACEKGDATALARLAPTSLVFGAWDSRSSQVKLPRLVDSTIRADQVAELSRGAQYFSALTKDEVESQLSVDSKEKRKPLSKAGFLDAPSRACGGVIVNGDVIRTTLVNFTALRSLGASTGQAALELRRYILGLCLVAGTAPMDLFLRQGCLLVRDENKPQEAKLVYRDGQRKEFTADFGEIEAYASATAEAFRVDKNARSFPFDTKIAKKLLDAAAKARDED